VAGKPYPADISDNEREAMALSGMMAARLPGEEAKRPSVESILHAMFPYRFVLHVHPPLVNGMTCGRAGKTMCRRLFGEKAVWVGQTKPGLVLARVCGKAFDEYTALTGKYPQVVLMENHGIFSAADSVGEIDGIVREITDKIKEYATVGPDFEGVEFDRDSACLIALMLRTLYSPGGMASTLFCTNRQVSEFVSDSGAFKTLCKPFTPDQIVYCKDEPLFIEPDADIAAAFSAYMERKGYRPKIVAVQGLGFFALGETLTEASRARLLFLDAVKIAVYARAFSGVSPLPDELTSFILNWEAEAYRSKAPVSNSEFRIRNSELFFGIV